MSIHFYPVGPRSRRTFGLMIFIFHEICIDIVAFRHSRRVVGQEASPTVAQTDFGNGQTTAPTITVVLPVTPSMTASVGTSSHRGPVPHLTVPCGW
jgi:hypothetical protein